MQVAQPYLRSGISLSARNVFLVTLAALLVVDLFFVGAHVVRGQLIKDPSYDGFLLNNDLWSIGSNSGLSELYMYMKAGGAALILFSLYLKRRTLTYLGWGLAFLYILLDDSLSLHENFAVFMAGNASLPTILGVEGEHYVAMVLWGLVGLVLMSIVAVGYLREPHTRRLSRRFCVLLGVLFFCGGVVDALRGSAQNQSQPLVTYVLERTIIIEDGGESVVLSFFLALALSHWLVERARLTSRASHGGYE